ncbi:TIGR03086 family metal-binding protein [Actinocorallia longicatena]|uniref:TIGR03086 family metal-binding protein n=1 Tax=Actinocorallia longicatena TaxID=111803 RepID=A0ABP6Q883_9ACTN
MDLNDLHRRSLEDLGAFVFAAKPADLAAPTPCAGWDLRALIGHLVAENRGFASAIGGPGDWTDDRLGDDPAETFAETAREVVGVFTDLERQWSVREFGTFPGKIAIRMHFIDNVAHSWDVARALDLPWSPEAGLAEAALTTVLAFPLSRGPGEAFAAEVDLPAGASAADRFLAYTGRDPR